MWFGGDAIMAAVMIALVVGCLRHVDTDKAEAKGWLEQAASRRSLHTLVSSRIRQTCRL